MLDQLYIRNIALVDELTIDFAGGLTVITGETGAGKSMLMNALGLALGDRLQSALVKQQQSGQVVASFDLDQCQEVQQWIECKDLQEHGQCLMRRSITASGNRCFINSTPVSQAQMSELGDMLIELHGQHLHHSLMEQPVQAQLFDSYCQLNDTAEQVAILAKQKKLLEKELAVASAVLEKNESDRQYIQFQVQEIEALAPKLGEYHKLDQQQKMAAAQQELYQAAEQAHEAINGKDGNQGAISTFNRLTKTFVNLPFDNCSNIANLFEQLEIQLDEASSQVRSLLDQTYLDQQQINEVEERLAQWHLLARKHHIKPDQLLQTLDTFKQKIEHLDQANTDEIIKKLEEVNLKFDELCRKLTEGRKVGVASFSEQVTQLLQQLAMPDASFRVELEQLENAAHQGLEKVHFFISTNLGGREQKMQAIVSGGELSRISLAIFTVCQQTKSHNRAMVFDEIDVGMSGSVAERIGTLLRNLGKKTQVICISHQPQVAAKADNHFLANKNTSSGVISISLDRLDEEQSIAEIARMLGSENTQAEAQALARRMYQQGQEL